MICTIRRDDKNFNKNIYNRQIDEKQRIDIIISTQINEITRSQTQDLITQGLVQVNGKKIKKLYSM